MDKFPVWLSNYKILSESDSEQAESEDGLLNKNPRPKTSSRVSFDTRIFVAGMGVWLIGTLVVVIYTISLRARLHYAQEAPKTVSSWETGFGTEFGPAKGTINIENIKFTGDIKFRSTDGAPYREAKPGELIYAGPPTPEIDVNWMKLIDKRYFYISEKEANEAFGESEENRGYFKMIDGEKRYVVGLDMMHNLHCVNELRKFLDPAYYADHMLTTMAHNYHCVDELRQYLMCFGDMTPVKTRWIEQRNRLYTDSNVVHTCRSYEPIQKWVWAQDIVYGTNGSHIE